MKHNNNIVQEQVLLKKKITSVFSVKLQVQWNDKHGGYGKHFFEYNHADGYFPLQSGAKPGDSGDFPEKFQSRTIRRL